MTDLAAQAREQKMRITLLPVAQSPHIARTFIRHGLLDLHMPDLVDDACLIASELVGNAVKHVPDADTYELTLSHNQGRPLIELWDPSPKPPMTVDLPDAEFGRGLHIISALASMWNYYTLPTECPGGGKVVWALLCPS